MVEDGSFREIPLDDDPYATGRLQGEFEDPKPEATPRLQECLEGLSSVIPTPVRSVYYPCCSYDITPSHAFPDAEVTYVDMDDRAMAALRAEGFAAHTACAPVPESEQLAAQAAPLYRPEASVDLLLLLNPGISHQEVVRDVSVGGHVVANNWHHTADALNGDRRFQVVAVFSETDDALHCTTEDFDKFFTPVDSDAELRAVAPEVHTQIEQILGTPALDAVASERHLLDMYIRHIAEAILSDGGCVQLGDDLLPRVPRKKNGLYFVFKKVR